VGYDAGLRAYWHAVEGLRTEDLTSHYGDGLRFFRTRFVPHLKATLSQLSGGVWDFDGYEAFAAGSDVDLMTHIVEAVAARGPVRLFPGDWFGFSVGATQHEGIAWDRASAGALACLCVPSVRNGHVTDEMLAFLDDAAACLLNLNLYPTLPSAERAAVARALSPVLPKSIVSISFSRGFGLTASQLGVVLVHREHPLLARLRTQWEWFSYFYNAIAARAFMALSLEEVAQVDERRRLWVNEWLRARELPVLESGSYYVRAFRAEGALPAHFAPLVRDEVVRLCFKPPIA
jgi:hypothetical protein